MKTMNANTRLGWRWLLISTAVTACATASGSDPAAGGGASPHYPRRAPGCQLSMFYTAVPGVPAWDDLGVAEANCHISDSQTECLRLLRAEACRMGGDIIYNVPRRPYRPRDQVVQYRAQVAHTRGKPVEVKTEDPDLPPPASSEESAGPVMPLPSGNAPPAEPEPDAATPAPPLPKAVLPPPAPRPEQRGASAP